MPVEIEERTPSGADRAFERKVFDVISESPTESPPIATIDIYPNYFAISLDSIPDIERFGIVAEELIARTKSRKLTVIDKDVGGYLTLVNGNAETFTIDEPVSSILKQRPSIASIRLNTPFFDIWFRKGSGKSRTGIISHAPIYEEAADFVTLLSPNADSHLETTELASEIQDIVENPK